MKDLEYIVNGIIVEDESNAEAAYIDNTIQDIMEYTDEVL